MSQEFLSWFNQNLCAEISMCLFLAVFIAVGIRAMLTKKEVVNYNAALPLDDGEADLS